MAHDAERQVEIPHELVAERAYALWLARGCPMGDPHTDWALAEQELVEESVAAEGHPAKSVDAD